MYKKVDISPETWNKTEVAAIKMPENDDVNKMLKLFLCISDVSIRWDDKSLYGLIDKEIKGKVQSRQSKIV